MLQLVRNSRVLGQHLDQHDTQSLLEVLLNVIFYSANSDVTELDQ